MNVTLPFLSSHSCIGSNSLFILNLSTNLSCYKYSFNVIFQRDFNQCFSKRESQPPSLQDQWNFLLGPTKNIINVTITYIHKLIAKGHMKLQTQCSIKELQYKIKVEKSHVCLLTWREPADWFAPLSTLTWNSLPELNYLLFWGISSFNVLDKIVRALILQQYLGHCYLIL